MAASVGQILGVVNRIAPPELAELEEELRDRFFVRISKSVIVNIKAVSSISPEDSRRVKLRLNNGEYLIVSRDYVNNFREAIGMKGGRSK